MNYLQFHLIFILPVLLILLFTTKTKKYDWLALTALSAICLIYTTPWDNFLIKEGVWTYSRQSVIGTIFYAPIEEYMFMILQPIVTGLWTIKIFNKYWSSNNTNSLKVVFNILITVFWLSLSLLGYFFLKKEPTYYLGLILVWACPVVALQWGYGANKIFKNVKVFLISWLVPTIYLCVADRIAIGYKVWTITPQFSTGLNIFGLPLEEIIFFTITNLLVVQGILLFKTDLEKTQFVSAL
jgi:lycopene beta-cyclase